MELAPTAINLNKWTVAGTFSTIQFPTDPVAARRYLPSNRSEQSVWRESNWPIQVKRVSIAHSDLHLQRSAITKHFHVGHLTRRCHRNLAVKHLEVPNLATVPGSYDIIDLQSTLIGGRISSYAGQPRTADVRQSKEFGMVMKNRIRNSSQEPTRHVTLGDRLVVDKLGLQTGDGETDAEEVTAEDGGIDTDDFALRID